MGIRGLPSYIFKSCDGVVNYNYKLRNMRVIIDGNNFFRTFVLNLRGAEDGGLPYGGNYDTIYSAMKTFFHKLAVCNIEPVVVFVGTTSYQDAIFERVKFRNEENIKNLEQFIADGYQINKSSTPKALCAQGMLIRFLNAHRIHHLTMDFEEDDEIVALANRWRCAIMTADSDFYVHEYREGARVIPIWRFDLHVNRDMDGCYIVVASYEVKMFADYHDFKDARLVALFAAILLENDERNNFMEFIPLQSEVRVEEINAIIGKIRDISRDKKFEEILDDVSIFFDGDDDEDLKQRIQSKVHEFLLKESKPEYYTYLEEDKTTVLSSSVKTHGDKSLPDWFIDDFRAANISRYFMGVLAKRVTSLYTQLEDTESPSPNEYATELRAVMYGILIKYDTPGNTLVTEFYREGKTIKEYTVSPTFEVVGYGKVPALDELPNLSVSDARRLLLRTLQVEEDIYKHLPDTTWMFILSTLYWIRKCQPEDCSIQALILCFIKMGIIDKKAPEGTLSLSSLTLGGNVWDVNSAAWSKAYRALQPNSTVPAIKCWPGRIKIHHVFAQWLTIYSEIFRLNKLLRHPVPELGPEECFRGTFLFTYHWQLSNIEDPIPFICQLLGSLVFKRIYLPLWNVIAPDR